MVGNDVDTGDLQALGSRFASVCRAGVSSGSVIPSKQAAQTYNCRTRWYLARPVVRRQPQLHPNGTGKARRTIDDQVVRVVRGDVTDDRSRPARRRPHLSFDVPAELVTSLPRQDRRVVRVRKPVVRVDAPQKLPDVRLRERGSGKLLCGGTVVEPSGRNDVPGKNPGRLDSSRKMTLRLKGRQPGSR